MARSAPALLQFPVVNLQTGSTVQPVPTSPQPTTSEPTPTREQVIAEAVDFMAALVTAIQAKPELVAVLVAVKQVAVDIFTASRQAPADAASKDDLEAVREMVDKRLSTLVDGQARTWGIIEEVERKVDALAVSLQRAVPATPAEVSREEIGDILSGLLEKRKEGESRPSRRREVCPGILSDFVIGLMNEGRYHDLAEGEFKGLCTLANQAFPDDVEGRRLVFERLTQLETEGKVRRAKISPPPPPEPEPAVAAEPPGTVGEPSAGPSREPKPESLEVPSVGAPVEIPPIPLGEVAGLDPETVTALGAAGYCTAQEVLRADNKDLKKVEGIKGAPATIKKKCKDAIKKKGQEMTLLAMAGKD